MFTPEENESFVFELKTAWNESNMEHGFDTYVYHQKVYDIMHADPLLKKLVNNYLYLLERFHFIDYYLTSTVENTVEESLKQLQKKGVDQPDIDWFNEINLKILFNEASLPILPSKKKLEEPLNIDTSQTEASHSYTPWQYVESVNSFGLIPLWLFPLIAYAGYLFTNTVISRGIYFGIIITFLIGIGINAFIVHDSTSYMLSRPWLRVYWVSMVLLLSATLSLVFLGPDIYQLNFFINLIRNIQTDVWKALEYSIIYGFTIYAVMSAIYYYWFKDDYEYRFKVIFLIIVLYVFGFSIVSFWRIDPTLQITIIIVFGLVSMIQLAGIMIRRFMVSDLIISLVQISIVIVSYFMHLRII